MSEVKNSQVFFSFLSGQNPAFDVVVIHFHTVRTQEVDVAILIGGPHDHSDDDSCGQRPDLCDHHSGERR